MRLKQCRSRTAVKEYDDRWKTLKAPCQSCNEDTKTTSGMLKSTVVLNQVLWKQGQAPSATCRGTGTVGPITIALRHLHGIGLEDNNCSYQPSGDHVCSRDPSGPIKSPHFWPRPLLQLFSKTTASVDSEKSECI